MNNTQRNESMTKSQVAIKYWENEVAEGRATKEVIELGDGRNSAIDKHSLLVSYLCLHMATIHRAV